MSGTQYLIDGEWISEKEYIKRESKRLRDKYVKNPPIGYTSEEISRMRDEDLLDMDYFLNE